MRSPATKARPSALLAVHRCTHPCASQASISTDPSGFGYDNLHLRTGSVAFTSLQLQRELSLADTSTVTYIPAHWSGGHASKTPRRNAPTTPRTAELARTVSASVRTTAELGYSVRRVSPLGCATATLRSSLLGVYRATALVK